MPWPSNGDYYSFKEASIKAKAPNASGVYGLYNIKQYVLIGESPDIREALLRHESETGFLFGLYRPIGFTFEVCSPELRASRAQQLIAEYRPILQVRHRLAFFRGGQQTNKHDRSNSKGAVSKGAVAASGTTHQPTPASTVASAKDSGKKLYFSRDQLVVLALAFTVTAASIAFLGVLTGKQLEATRIVKNETSSAKVSIDPPDEAAGAVPTGADEGASSFRPPANGPDAQPTNEALSPAALRQQSAISQPGKRAEPMKAWAVQVKAAPDKPSADAWVNRLKSKGYDAFVVEADIRGKTWYRVRVGSFDTRQDAEKLRKVLEVEEGLADAYLTRTN